MSDADVSPRPRADAIARIADAVAVANGSLDHPIRVAVDGITAAGKTTLAAELAAAVAAMGLPAIHVSMDGFHFPRSRRHRRGRWSVEGYYEDAYDVEAFVREVLRPLGPQGDRRYRTSVFDLASDEPVAEPPLLAAVDAVLFVDGSFLQRPELTEHWDRTIFVHTSFAVARARGTQRDAELFGGVEQAERAYDLRYHPACRLYLDTVRPQEQATVVVDNDDPAAPTVTINQRG